MTRRLWHVTTAMGHCARLVYPNLTSPSSKDALNIELEGLAQAQALSHRKRKRSISSCQGSSVADAIVDVESDHEHTTNAADSEHESLHEDEDEEEEEEEEDGYEGDEDVSESEEEDDNDSEYEDLPTRRRKRCRTSSNRKFKHRSASSVAAARVDNTSQTSTSSPSVDWLDGDNEPILDDADLTTASSSDEYAEDEFMVHDTAIKGVASETAYVPHASWVMKRDRQGTWAEDSDDKGHFVDLDTGERCAKTGHMAPREGCFVKALKRI